ncbi:hypothetical protein P4S72_20010 [Vibrio sp. PP-XX7]
MINHMYSKLFAITIIANALSACNSNSNSNGETYTLPLSPKSITQGLTISEPALSGMSVAVVDGDIPVTNNKNNTVAYMKDYNPIVQILSGFDDIWSLVMTHGREQCLRRAEQQLMVYPAYPVASNSTN